MKKILLLFIIISLMVTGCIQTVSDEIVTSEPIKTSTPEKELSATPAATLIVYTKTPTSEPTITNSPAPTETPEPSQTDGKKSLSDSLPQPTPVYVPTDDDLAFKEQVIEEGKILAFDMTEWELIDIMCDILGKDEYVHRLISYEEHPNELYLRWTRDELEGLQYTIYILDTQNGDIFCKDETENEYIVGNIFTSEA